jgi:hypothetical protein
VLGLDTEPDWVTAGVVAVAGLVGDGGAVVGACTGVVAGDDAPESAGAAGSVPAGVAVPVAVAAGVALVVEAVVVGVAPWAGVVVGCSPVTSAWIWLW